MDDVRAVLDAAGSERAALFGFSEGGNLSVLFAATYPQRTTALALYAVFAKRIWSPDYPWAPTPEAREREIAELERTWAAGMDVDQLAPSEDEAFKRRLATYFRRSASPGAAVALLRMNTQIDVRSVLPAIHAPTLVMHRVNDQDTTPEEGRWIADRIPGARFIELPGDAHVVWAGDTDQVVDEIEEFLDRGPAWAGSRSGTRDGAVHGRRRVDRRAHVSSATAAGGSCSTGITRSYERELARFQGHEVDTAGDGFLATFDGPARGIRCARAITDGVRDLGLEIRAGLHTGECELVNGGVRGIAVHTGARVAAKAGAGEVLVSSTVKDLVAGSGIEFDDRGMHELKGVPGEWRLYAVASA